jgi:hypothetical protein
MFLSMTPSVRDIDIQERIKQFPLVNELQVKLKETRETRDFAKSLVQNCTLEIGKKEVKKILNKTKCDILAEDYAFD